MRKLMSVGLRALLISLLGLTSCGTTSGVRVRGADNWRSYVQGNTSDLSSMRFTPGLCDSLLPPERKKLSEGDIVEFLQRQGVNVQIERPRADLSYIVITGEEVVGAVRLRVAILPSAEDAGEQLHGAILEHGPGAWGIHRSNVAILAQPSSVEHAVVFAARTKLACWGVFTIAGRDDAFVIPGGYLEI